LEKACAMVAKVIGDAVCRTQQHVINAMYEAIQRMTIPAFSSTTVAEYHADFQRT